MYFCGDCSSKGADGYEHCGCDVCENHYKIGDEEGCHLDNCDVRVGDCCACGRRGVGVTTSASIFGAYSMSYCDECMLSGRESYTAMVHFIATVGEFPNDISECYQNEVRMQLKLHNITEQKFISDVKSEIRSLYYMRE
jgi:hypothetical protein